MANHYVSTHPDSQFTQRLTVQRPSADARYILRGRELAIYRASSIESRAVGGAELESVVRDTFGIELDADMDIAKL